MIYKQTNRERETFPYSDTNTHNLIYTQECSSRLETMKTMDYRVLIAIPCVVFVVAAIILAVGFCCKARKSRAATSAASAAAAEASKKKKAGRKSLPLITCTHANAGPLQTQESLLEGDNKRHSANVDLVDVGVTSVAQTLRVV